MVREIGAAVDRYSSLQLKVNKGERHRIMRTGIRSGSLWIRKRGTGFRVVPTGDVYALVAPYLTMHFGPEAQEDQGKKVWFVRGIEDVEKIVQRFAE